MKFSGVITSDQSKVHAKSQGQRSKVKVTEVKTQLSRFEFTYGDVAKKRYSIVFQGHPSNFKVTWLKKLSNLTQIGRFRTVTPVLIHQWLRNDAQSLK